MDIDNNQCFVSTLVNVRPDPDPVVYLNAYPDLDPDPVPGFEITLTVKKSSNNFSILHKDTKIQNLNK